MRQTPHTISLVITTYNRPMALEVVLLCAINQTVSPNEIIVADDGSDEKTKAIVDKISELTDIKIVHSWQPDDGFRLSASRNQAIAIANSEYIILVDGDMLLDKNYVKDYLNAAKRGTLYVSSRVHLTEDFTKQLEYNHSENPKVNILGNGILKNRLNGIRIPLIYKFLKKIDSYNQAKGYMGFWKEDFIKVNGFDEKYKGWGREDSDFLVRMINSGVEARKLKFAAIAFHMYHKSASKDDFEKNNTMLFNTIQNKVIRCDDGVDKYLNKI